MKDIHKSDSINHEPLAHEGHEEKGAKAPSSFSTWYDKEQLIQSKAIIVGAITKNTTKEIQEEHLDELDQLAQTYGIPIIDRWCTPLREISPATFLSSGKVEMLRERLQEVGANLVIFDDEISPAQQRNLEQELKVPVMDRTEVILGVFADRAKSHEAKLQIELAQVRYVAPRLKRMWTHLSRQSGGGGGASGGGYLKGEGEKQIEIDRRILKARLEKLEHELKDVQQYRHTQRSLRERNEVPVFAIVGYTNAGKSTLMKRLTNADILVEDKLFATLDTTTRHFTLPNNQDILLVDTVGFIRKLPHLLVAAFKSTLEEAVQAEILLHLIDTSHPQALEQAKTTLEVLEELNAKDKPIITVLNKVDRLREPERHGAMESMIHKLRMTYPRAIQISAATGEGIDELFQEMILVLQSRRKRVMLKIPQSEYHIAASAIRLGTIFSQSYEENDVILDVELPISHAERLKAYSMQNQEIAK